MKFKPTILFRLVQSVGGARALARFNIQSCEPQKLSCALAVGTWKRRERRAPLAPNDRPFVSRTAIALAVALCGLVPLTGNAQTASASATNAVAAATENKPDITPITLPGSEAFVFRTAGTNELRLFVVKPKGWAKSDKRPCFVSYFGGGWVSGSPERSVSWAKWAAGYGLVGVAPDYRTRGRFNGTPEDCVSDARAAMRWVEEHAEELGIDPKKIIAHGGSAGGHVAAWTAIPSDGPGKNDPAPKISPAALVLLNPVTDTKDTGYGGSKRFGATSERALACSVPDQMPKQMPPTIVFHATGDKTVPYSNSVAFKDKMIANGNRCELVTFEGLGHSYNSSKFGEAGKVADKKTREDIVVFLTSLGLIEKGTK